MTDTSRSGRAVERKAVEALEEAGYKVHRCIKTVVKTPVGPRTVGQDVFGCIDLVAKKAGEPTRWIQVTKTRAVGEKVADLAAVPWTDAHDSVEIWRWVGGRHRIDGRTGLPCPRQYFQIYRRRLGFRLDKSDRVQTLRGPGAAVGRAAPAAVDQHAQTQVEDVQSRN